MSFDTNHSNERDTAKPAESSDHAAWRSTLNGLPRRAFPRNLRLGVVVNAPYLASSRR